MGVYSVNSRRSAGKTLSRSEERGPGGKAAKHGQLRTGERRGEERRGEEASGKQDGRRAKRERVTGRGKTAEQQVNARRKSMTHRNVKKKSKRSSDRAMRIQFWHIPSPGTSSENKANKANRNDRNRVSTNVCHSGARRVGDPRPRGKREKEIGGGVPPRPPLAPSPPRPWLPLRPLSPAWGGVM